MRRLRIQGWRWRRLILWIGGALLAGVSLANWDFALIIRNAEHRYGNLGPARDRLLEWEALIKSSAALAEPDKLNEVNRFFNRTIRFVDDIQLWRENDYWATPVEMLVKGAGDCEDYSIAKYFTLRRLGVPADKLRITYVKALNYNQAHMVLTYYASPSAEPLVLDNLINDIRPAGRRPDLFPVFSFSDAGLWVAGASQSSADPTTRLSRWRDVLDRMSREGIRLVGSP